MTPGLGSTMAHPVTNCPCSGWVNSPKRPLGVSFTSAAHDIQTRAISAAAKPASSSDKYQSGFFFTTRQIDPINTGHYLFVERFRSVIRIDW